MIISSDGHAMARMRDYRPYLPTRYRSEFDGFCDLYDAIGSRSFDKPALSRRLDPQTVDKWMAEMNDPGRLQGCHDLSIRLKEMEQEGIAAEVIFPDFGLPFEIATPASKLQKDSGNYPQRTPDMIDAANQAHNRWLVDWSSDASHRFAVMASTRFDDVDAAIMEIRWAKEHGFSGVMLPMFDEAEPVFAPKFDPIWSTLEELDMPANSHVAISSTTRTSPMLQQIPHPSLAIPLISPIVVFHTHQMLNHLIWGGVFERHPNLKIVFTEQGSGWVPAALSAMDYSYEGSYLRRDTHEIVKSKPSDYFARQGFIGSSLFSRAEIASRDQIGVDKMMLGMDYPHHEGTFAEGGTLDYLQATLGATGTGEADACRMLGTNAADVFGFDLDKLRPFVNEFGPPIDTVLTPPTTDLFPRGDVKKPLSVSAL